MKKNSISSLILHGPSFRKQVLIGGIAVLSVGAADAQWTAEPVLKAGFERDDNATLSIRTDDVKNVDGLLLDASARIEFNSTLTDFFVEPRVLSRSYSDNPEIDSDDIFLESVYRRDTESSIFRIRMDYEDQTVRTAERADTDFDIDDPDDISDDDAGAIGFQDQRQKWRIRPQWNYQFNESSSMALSAQYQDTSYGDELQMFLRDFSDTKFAASYNRKFSPRSTGTFTLNARNYQVSDGTSETTGLGFLAGVSTLLSPTTTAKVMIGMEDTDSDLTNNDPQVVANFSLRRRLQTVNVLAQYRRAISASGAGRLSSRDSLNLNLSRRLSDKASAGLGVRTYQTSSLDDSVSIDERTYVQLRSQFIWNFTPSIAAEVDYRFTFQKRSTLNESANSNQVTLWFVYRPNSVDRRFGENRNF